MKERENQYEPVQTEEELLAAEEECEAELDADMQKIIAVAQAAVDAEKKKTEELTAICKRVQAEFDNYRKRTAEQTLKIREDVLCEVIERFLPSLDVVETAIKMIEDEKVRSGVVMIQKQLEDILKLYGVEEIPALFEAFDPNYHNAIMRVEDADNSGKVTEVFQKGYRLSDRIIRYATVKVAN